MEQKRGILILADPLLRKDRFSQMQIQSTTLVFHENEHYLSQAQSALQKLRKSVDWLCVAASGGAVGVALALAAQLPVDRLALWMEEDISDRPRQLLRIDAFARRNLSLVISEILLISATDIQTRRLIRGLGRSRGLRCIAPEEYTAQALTAPWPDQM